MQFPLNQACVKILLQHSTKLKKGCIFKPCRLSTHFCTKSTEKCSRLGTTDKCSEKDKPTTVDDANSIAEANSLEKHSRYTTPLLSTKDQLLYRATDADVELFNNAKLLPTKPIDLENSIVIRLVDLNEKVTSPVGSSVLYSEYGIRDGEFRRFLLLGICVCGILTSLGFWQLRRREWKTQLLSQRHISLDLPKLRMSSFNDIDSSLASNDAPNKLIVYRPVEATGVLDTNYTFLVGPRASITQINGNKMGYYVLCPLRFRDGSAVLVNMGWLDGDVVLNMRSTPEWITVRGILINSETADQQFTKKYILGLIESFLSYIFDSDINLSGSLNTPSQLIRDNSTKVYKYLDPSTIGAQFPSKSPSNTKKYIVNVYDSLFDNDVIGSTPGSGADLSYTPKSKIGAEIQKAMSIRRYNFERKQKSDYLLFYADPDTHLNYAVQWFLMALSIGLMCIYKYTRINSILRI